MIIATAGAAIEAAWTASKPPAAGREELVPEEAEFAGWPVGWVALAAGLGLADFSVKGSDTGPVQADASSRPATESRSGAR
jgi:hypothetical protein